MTPYIFPGDKRRSALDTIQARIDALTAQRSDLVASPLPLAECRDRLDRELGAHSSLEYRAKAALLSRQRGAEDAIRSDEPLTLSDLQWLFGRDFILGKMVSALTPVAEAKPPAVSAEDFTTQAAGIDQQLHDLYIQEEQEVLRLYDEGIKVTRRENVDVSVVFNIWNKEPSDEQK